MRRKDREITDIPAILAIMDQCQICELALCADNHPYVLPLNFGYSYTDGGLVLYFHGAREGKKLDLMRQNPNAAFAMHCSCQFVEADAACECTMNYQSVMGTGTIEILENADEKRAGLLALMRQYQPEKEPIFSPAALQAVAVFKLTVTEFTAKQRKG